MKKVQYYITCTYQEGYSNNYILNVIKFQDNFAILDGFKKFRDVNLKLEATRQK